MLIMQYGRVDGRQSGEGLHAGWASEQKAARYLSLKGANGFYAQTK
jgi:hypothetical protein